MLLGYAWISNVVQKVFSGAGLEYCCSIDGVEFNNIAAFVLLCGIAVGLLVVGILQMRHRLIVRNFEARYGVRLNPSQSRSTNVSSVSPQSSFSGAERIDGD